MSIPRFGFLVTFLSYIALLFAEYLRSGFVSSSMNVHVFWVVMFVWSIIEILAQRNSHFISDTTKFTNTPLLIRCIACIIGMILTLIVWHIGALFGDMRLFFALAVGILPLVLLK